MKRKHSKEERWVVDVLASKKYNVKSLRT